jgi:quinol monooxygenase YgiN
MYGIIGQLKSTPGDRKKLIDILLCGTTDMPGCRLYAIAADTSDDVSIWITEIWDSQELHQASLQLPSVQAAIGAGKPLIAGFGERHIVTPVGGHGVATKVAQ